MILSFLVLLVIPAIASGTDCRATTTDALGPFYKPNSPVRSKVGSGYVLSGTVRSTDGCNPVPNAQVEFWMAGPGSDYSDEFRATLYSNKAGAYRFESHIPPAYYGRPPHIHIRVSAPGFRTLVTQHYPKPGKVSSRFDLVLIPETQQ